MYVKCTILLRLISKGTHLTWPFVYKPVEALTFNISTYWSVIVSLTLALLLYCNGFLVDYCAFVVTAMILLVVEHFIVCSKAFQNTVTQREHARGES